jgi:hypothetical protein
MPILSKPALERYLQARFGSSATTTVLRSHWQRELEGSAEALWVWHAG